MHEHDLHSSADHTCQPRRADAHPLPVLRAEHPVPRPAVRQLDVRAAGEKVLGVDRPVRRRWAESRERVPGAPTPRRVGEAQGAVRECSPGGEQNRRRRYLRAGRHDGRTEDDIVGASSSPLAVHRQSSACRKRSGPPPLISLSSPPRSTPMNGRRRAGFATSRHVRLPHLRHLGRGQHRQPSRRPPPRLPA
jgi:hypothetical protein